MPLVRSSTDGSGLVQHRHCLECDIYMSNVNLIDLPVLYQSLAHSSHTRHEASLHVVLATRLYTYM